MSDFNVKVIDDFRKHAGQTPNTLAGRPIILIHTIGAKSGEPRVQPLMFLQQGADSPWYIFASYGGAPKDPAWFHNIVAHPHIEIEVGDGTTIDRVPVHATVLEGELRDGIYAEMARQWPQFADYEEKTTRDAIPVIELRRRS